MDWIEVESSRINKVAFDSENKKVYIEFKNNGSTYVYNDITKEVFNIFINSESKGKAIPLLGKNYQKLN